MRTPSPRELLETALHHAPDLVCILDAAGCFLSLNAAGEHALGCAGPELAGKPFAHLLAPDEGAAVQQQCEAAYLQCGTLAFTGWCRVLAGPATRLAWSGFRPPGTDFLLCTGRPAPDIEAGQQPDVQALVATATGNGVVITNAQGLTEWVNPAFTRLTGYDLADMRGQTPGAVLQGPDTDPEDVRRIRERLPRALSFSASILNYKKSGQPLWLAMDISPVHDAAGLLTHYVAVQQNVTHRKTAEASQAKVTQELYRHNRDLQQFAYAVAHNLRQPLANAAGLAEVLGRVDPAAPLFAPALSNLTLSLAELEAVMQQLNTILNVQDHREEVPREPVALAEVGQQALHDLQGALAECGGTATADFETGLVALSNREFLYHIFFHLLANAIKYRAPDRPLILALSCFRGEHGGPTIALTDNGSGFDTAKAHSDAFQLYKHLHANQRGRGIGLFMVKSYVEALGGQIVVTAAEPFGTRFLLHLAEGE